MSKELEVRCSRCGSVHGEGAARWRCDGCGGKFCSMDLVDGKRWNHRGPIHVGMRRDGQFRACGRMLRTEDEEVKPNANEAAAPDPSVPGLPEGVPAQAAQPNAL